MDNVKQYIPLWMKTYPRPVDTSSLVKAGVNRCGYYCTRGNGKCNNNARGRKGSL